MFIRNLTNSRPRYLYSGIKKIKIDEKSTSPQQSAEP